MGRVDDPPLTSAQHARIKRASPYAYRQFQAREAARRESRRCCCEIDPGVQPQSVIVIVSWPTANQVTIGYVHHDDQRQPFLAAHVFMDAAGAHMWPGCPHSELWRTTRPMAAVTAHYDRTGRWPDRLSVYGGIDQAKRPPRLAA